MVKIMKNRNSKFILGIVVGIIGIAVMTAILINMSRPQEVYAVDPGIERQEKINLKILESRKLVLGYFYDEALNVLRSDPELIDETVTDDAISLEIAKVELAKNSLVKYEGPFDHVFFHSLIIYPKLAFDKKGHPAQGYNMWMTTVKEFKSMLPQLYKRGYVLYPLNEYISVTSEGKIILKDIYLPPGKKPLVISIDDVNYYDYMKSDGFANRLVVGNDGRVCTEVITPEGKIINTRDGDVMPILDDFVLQHPDFSWRGAKGVIAVTGYEGVLGYRITDNLPEEAVWQQEVKKIADMLKADGWLFACHSYTHNGYFRDGRLTMAKMKYDTDRWKQKIAPWVGETNIYISPFGWHYSNKNSIHRYLVESGYQIFCPVDISRKITMFDGIMNMPRVNLDGYTMVKRPNFVNEHYYNVSEVLDAERPRLNID